MKLTYLKTHWTASDAILLMEFLEDMRQVIAANYRDDIDLWFKEMADNAARQYQEKACSCSHEPEENIPF